MLDSAVRSIEGASAFNASVGFYRKDISMADGKVMIVTGGSRGIGAATARLAATRGYAVCVGYQQNRVAAEEVVQTSIQGGDKASAVAADVAGENDVARLFETADRELGTVTALVYNAGLLERQCRVDETDAARLQRILSANVIGSFLCAKQAVLRMSTRYGGVGGAIVNLSSAAARLGAPNEYVDYAASKGAIDTLTIGLAKDVAAEGIRVNAVRPGVIDTDIHASGGEPGRVERDKDSIPLRRGRRAEEVAKAIRRDLSADSSFSSSTRQAGESVRRIVTRTSLALSANAGFIFSIRSLFCASTSSCCFFSASSSSLPRSRSPLATDTSSLPSNSVRKDSIHSSTRSIYSNTSTPFLRKISRCGLFFAAAYDSPVT